MKITRLLTCAVLVLGILPFAFGDTPPPADAATTERDRYLVSVLQGIADFATPGVGIDANTYLPLDHVRIDPDSEMTWSKGMYSAASKISAYILFLYKVHEGNSYFGQIHLVPTSDEAGYLHENALPPNNQSIALARMLMTLDTIEDMLSEDKLGGTKYGGGMVPWISIYPDGTVRRDKDLVPLLDNGLLSWAYAAIAEGLATNQLPLAVQVRTKIEKLLARQDYSVFFDAAGSRFFGEIDVGTGGGNPKYVLNQLWTEDLLAVLWGLFTVDMPADRRAATMDALLAPVVEWTAESGEVIDVPKGYIASNHEPLWTLLFLPLRELRLARAFYNSQYAQADYARKSHVPGFQATAYDSLGTYVKMGIPAAAQHPDYIQRHDCAVPFATAAAILMAPDTGKWWVHDLVKDHRLLTALGPLESVGPGGRRADILSADSQYLTALCLGGGVGGEIRRYLERTKVAGTEMTRMDFLRQMCARAEKRVLIESKLEQIRISTNAFPKPPKRDYEAETVDYPLQPPTFEILENLAKSPEDRHGASVFSERGRNMRWDIGDGIMNVEYSIPKDSDPYTRFAWWGTYLDTNRPYLAGFTHVKVTVPDTAKRHRFNLMLKREDTSLVQPIVVDTASPGVTSDDGEWQTYTYKLQHRKRFSHLPVSYVAFSIDDPVRNPEFPAADTVRIKSIQLVNELIRNGPVDVRIAIEQIGGLPPFVPGPRRPAPLTGSERPRILASGAVGGATEDITHEEKSLLYVEFENVNITNGFSGIWLRVEDASLNDYRHLVFDALAGPAGPAPNVLRIECKNAEELTETLQCAWNVNASLSDARVSRTNWTRFVLPVPRFTSPKPFNLLTIIYENYVGQQPSGSLEISSPSFVASETTNFAEDVTSVVPLSPELEPGASISLLPYWQLQKLDASRDATVTVDRASGYVSITANGGWTGARVYPSFMAYSLGDTATLVLEPVGDEPANGILELKYGRVQHVKSKKFTVTRDPNSPGDQKVEIPLFFRTSTDQVDYISLSSIRGSFILKDIRFSRKPQEAPSTEPQSTP